MSRPPAECPIVGTWRLVRYDVIARGSQEGRPRWAETRGQLIYTADGALSVHLCNAAQQSFDARRRWDGSNDEKARAYDDYLAYAGTYRWEGDRVVHVIEQCIFPNWVGGEQVRRAELDGDRLTLTNPDARDDGAVSLVWERVTDR